MFLGPVESTQAEAEIQPAVHMVETIDNYAHFQIEPLRRGFAHTLGNPSRPALGPAGNRDVDRSRGQRPA